MGYNALDPSTWRPPMNPMLTRRARHLWRRVWVIEVVWADGSAVVAAVRLGEAAANRAVERRR